MQNVIGFVDFDIKHCRCVFALACILISKLLNSNLPIFAYSYRFDWAFSMRFECACHREFTSGSTAQTLLKKARVHRNSIRVSFMLFDNDYFSVFFPNCCCCCRCHRAVERNKMCVRKCAPPG